MFRCAEKGAIMTNQQNMLERYRVIVGTAADGRTIEMEYEAANQMQAIHLARTGGFPLADVAYGPIYKGRQSVSGTPKT